MVLLGRRRGFFSSLSTILIILHLIFHPSLSQTTPDPMAETLHIQSVSPTHVHVKYQFTATSTALTDDYNGFPKPIGKILHHIPIRSFNLSLSAGKWPKRTKPKGALLIAKLAQTHANRAWTHLTSSLSGLVCATLSKMDTPKSAQPLETTQRPLNFRDLPPQWNPNQSISNPITSIGIKKRTILNNPQKKNIIHHPLITRVSYLPYEEVCTANLAPLLRLLPCSSGIEKLINPMVIAAAPYHSIGIEAESRAEDGGLMVKVTVEMVTPLYSTTAADTLKVPEERKRALEKRAKEGVVESLDSLLLAGIEAGKGGWCPEIGKSVLLLGKGVKAGKALEEERELSVGVEGQVEVRLDGVVGFRVYKLHEARRVREGVFEIVQDGDGDGDGDVEGRQAGDGNVSTDTGSQIVRDGRDGNVSTDTGSQIVRDGRDGNVSTDTGSQIVRDGNKNVAVSDTTSQHHGDGRDGNSSTGDGAVSVEEGSQVRDGVSDFVSVSREFISSSHFFHERSSSRLLLSFRNDSPTHSVSLRCADLLPFYLRPHLHTLQLLHSAHVSSPFSPVSSASLLNLNLTAPVLPGSGTHLDFELELPAKSTATISFDIEKRFLPASFYTAVPERGLMNGWMVCTFGSGDFLFSEGGFTSMTPLFDFAMLFNALALGVISVTLFYTGLFKLLGSSLVAGEDFSEKSSSLIFKVVDMVKGVIFDDKFNKK